MQLAGAVSQRLRKTQFSVGANSPSLSVAQSS